jgi:hypothetical protein
MLTMTVEIYFQLIQQVSSYRATSKQVKFNIENIE